MEFLKVAEYLIVNLLVVKQQEMPGIYSKENFDLAGFSVGIVSKKKNSSQG